MPLEMTKLTDLEGDDLYIVDSWVTSVHDVPPGESLPNAGCKVNMSDASFYVRETKEQVIEKMKARVK